MVVDLSLWDFVCAMSWSKVEVYCTSFIHSSKIKSKDLFIYNKERGGTFHICNLDMYYMFQIDPCCVTCM